MILRVRTLMCVILALLFVLPTQAQQIPPKREFRAVWIATVSRLDWPPGNSTSSQMMQAMRQQLDALKGMGINAVIFQVRPESDAMYQSQYEPWSHHLTGQQGRAPSPFFDPLAYIIQEANKRGMEVHAWFNPYRVQSRENAYAIADNHITKTRPEWLLRFTPSGSSNTLVMLDPGKQAVRDYVTNVIMDVVRNYDVDGIHFDDYFYPYSPQITNQDAATFEQERDPGCTRVQCIPEWRRENVNRLIRQVRDSINSVKPHIKFGISPFGIWRSGTPSGIVGMDAYSVIYADAPTWMQRLYLDYLTPQLYWAFGGGQDYGTLARWWDTQRNGRHLYPGLGAYRSEYSTNEIPRQVRFNRTNNIPGSVFFRAQNLEFNDRRIRDSLRTNLNIRPAFPPTMEWKGDLTPPQAPTNVEVTLGASNRRTITWEQGALAADGDTARYYAIYRFPRVPAFPADLETSQFLVNVVGGAVRSFDDTPPAGDQTWHYVVTALDRNWNESEPAMEGGTTSMEDVAELAGQLLLETFPNPAEGFATTRFVLDRPEPITLNIYNALGQQMLSVLEGAQFGAGLHGVRWSTSGFTPGTYLVRLESSRGVETHTVTVLR